MTNEAKRPSAEELRELDRTAPERIFLQISDDDDDRDEPFPYNDEVTWCADSVVATEVEYVRADLMPASLQDRPQQADSTIPTPNTVSTAEELVELALDYENGLAAETSSQWRKTAFYLRELAALKSQQGWQDIATAPRDREIAVYAPVYQDLQSMVSKCQWHEDAGFCIDELREPKLWIELPKGPQS